MKINEIKAIIKYLHDDITHADYQKENYPTVIEDVLDKLNECLTLLN